jgi:hypothetical protein
VCKHKEADIINEMLARGVRATTVGVLYKLSHDAVSRHKREHLVMGNPGAENVVLSLQDVIDIPLQMRGRQELLQALIDRSLAPLMGPDTDPKNPAMSRVPLGFLIQCLKLQQQDEQTVLKITGILREDGDMKRADLVMTEQYRRMADLLERKLAELAGGDHAKQVLLEQNMAQWLLEEAEHANHAPSGHDPVDVTTEAWSGWGDGSGD